MFPTRALSKGVEGRVLSGAPKRKAKAASMGRIQEGKNLMVPIRGEEQELAVREKLAERPHDFDGQELGPSIFSSREKGG